MGVHHTDAVVQRFASPTKTDILYTKTDVVMREEYYVVIFIPKQLMHYGNLYGPVVNTIFINL